jgi:hypothetical protein
MFVRDGSSRAYAAEVVAVDEKALAFYGAPAPMTELPFDTLSAYLSDLPADPLAAAEVVRGVLVHRDWAPGLGLHFDAERLADQHRRSMRDVVERIVELTPAPITSERPLADRMVGVCRHFATLHVALLRHAGVPARARVGFARYFGDGWVDHWITEWFDGGSWVRTDPQVGAVAAKVLGLTFDPAHQPPGEFLDASEAWLRCRAGDEDPSRFGIFDLRGIGFIIGNVTQDLAALNKIELLPWDGWGTLGRGPAWVPNDAEAAPIDALARMIRDDDLERLRARFASSDVAVPPTITSYFDGIPSRVELEPSLLMVS